METLIWICWTVMLTSLTSYLVACKITKRTDHSISATWFKWPGWKQIWFSLSLWGVAIPIWVIEAYAVDWVSLDVMQFIGHVGMIVSAFFLFLIGVFPNYKRSKFEEIMHVVPSFGCIILGMISLFFVGWPIWIISVIPFLGFTSTAIVFKARKIRNMTRWLEIAAWIWTLIGILLIYI
jgi:hypothetical protein